MNSIGMLYALLCLLVLHAALAVINFNHELHLAYLLEIRS